MVYDLSKTIIDSETGEIISQGDQGPEADAQRAELDALRRIDWEERKARNRASAEVSSGSSESSESDAIANDDQNQRSVKD